MQAELEHLKAHYGRALRLRKHREPDSQVPFKEVNVTLPIEPPIQASAYDLSTVSVSHNEPKTLYRSRRDHVYERHGGLKGGSPVQVSVRILPTVLLDDFERQASGELPELSPLATLSGKVLVAGLQPDLSPFDVFIHTVCRCRYQRFW